ncbi:MAG: DUF1631 domain-containing protein [Proteobacteria bacterium]|nr:DUF1631 domain-containing protein [Pseudomonadota bacterium]
MAATPTTAAPSRRPPTREAAKALHDCRDLAIHRLQLSFSAMLDRVSDLLMERASKSDVRSEQSLYLDTRGVLKTERATLMSEFERHLRRSVDDRVSGKVEKAEFASSDVDPTKMTLVDTTVMDEAVLTGNITRIVENSCHDQLAEFNRSIGYLLDKPGLETDGNPLAPQVIVDAFADALKQLKAERPIKFQVLKELNQTSLGDIAAIYSDMNQHLLNTHAVPATAMRPRVVQRNTGGERGKPAPEVPEKKGPASPEVDMMSLFKRMFGGGAAAAMTPPRAPAPAPAVAEPGGLPMIDPALMGGAAAAPAAMPAASAPMFMPMPATPSGYVPGAPIMATPALHEGLTRLQAGQSGFEIDGAAIAFSGIPEGLHNVLRDLQQSPLASRATQLEAMTIEMVAMLFDFVFETRDLPDGIKALLARLQIPVLKAAMLDGAFFAKKQHPARLLVNELAAAGLGWSPAAGTEDPLYKEIDKIVRAILDGFANDLAIFDVQREDLAKFLASEEAAAQTVIATGAQEIERSDRAQMAAVVARAEVERRIEQSPVPQFLAGYLRERWSGALLRAAVDHGEDSDAWNNAVQTLEDLVWSVQPKRTTDDRKHLVAMLPSLLKRMNAGTQSLAWAPADREQFMSNLVEAHAAAVKPGVANTASPTALLAENAKAQAEIAKAAGDEQGAQKATALAEAMTVAEPLAPEEPAEIVDDDFLEIAKNLERGMWIEFENDDGQLVFAKLAWVSPLRGTYLFTNRQGQKALSMTAEELAERFRADTARVVEAEPLIDRAFSSVLGQLEQQISERAA